MTTTGTIFLICFSAGLLLTLIRHPIYGLYTYMAVFYLHPPSRWWGESLPDVRWSLVAAAITMISVIRLPNTENSTNWLRSKSAKLFFAYVIFMWVQSAWALNITYHKEGVILFTKYLMLFYLIVSLITSEKRITEFLLAHVAGCFYFGYLGFVAQQGGRLEGVGGPGLDDANTLAMHLSTGVICGAMVLLGGNRWQKLFCLIALPFILNVVILAGSRGAFLGLVCGGVILTILRPAAYRRQYYVFAALGLVLFSYLAHDLFWQRMSSLTAAVDETQELDHSAESRLVLFEAQLQMVRKHPLGAGFRGTTAQSRDYLELEYLDTDEGPVEIFGARSSHNTVMTVLVDQGIPGIILFSMMVMWAYRTLSRLNMKRAAGVTNLMQVQRACMGGVLVAVLGAGMFTSYFKAEVQLWFIALLASLEQLAIKNEARQPDPESIKKDESAGSFSRFNRTPLRRNRFRQP